mgnify:CR=1 FL=1
MVVRRKVRKYNIKEKTVVIKTKKMGIEEIKSKIQEDRRFYSY